MCKKIWRGGRIAVIIIGLGCHRNIWHNMWKQSLLASHLAGYQYAPEIFTTNSLNISLGLLFSFAFFELVFTNSLNLDQTRRRVQDMNSMVESHLLHVAQVSYKTPSILSLGSSLPRAIRGEDGRKTNTHSICIHSAKHDKPLPPSHNKL